MSARAKNGWVGIVTAAASCFAIAGLLWVLTPHPRSYTVAANPVEGIERLAAADAVTIAYRAEAPESATR